MDRSKGLETEKVMRSQVVMPGIYGATSHLCYQEPQNQHQEIHSGEMHIAQEMTYQEVLRQ